MSVQVPQKEGDVVTVLSYGWELRDREVRSLAGGHTAGTCQSWDLNLGGLPLETLPLTTALRLAELVHPLAWPGLACGSGGCGPHRLSMLQG